MFNKFIQPTAKVIKKVDKFGDVMKSLQGLQKQEVLIGIPQDKGPRKEPGITNAQLAYIHSLGSPLTKDGNGRGIPARPFLQPSIVANKEQLAARQAKIIKDALAGNATLIQADLNRLGMIARDNAKGWFNDARNHWAENKPATVARKGSDKPLIDTGQLRNAIQYVLNEK